MVELVSALGRMRVRAGFNRKVATHGGAAMCARIVSSMAVTFLIVLVAQPGVQSSGGEMDSYPCQTQARFGNSISRPSEFPLLVLSGVLSARGKQLGRVAMINMLQSLTAKPESI